MPSVMTDDGVSINYYLDDYLDPWLDEPSKDTIVLYSALWEPATFLAPMVPFLARKFRCLRIDMRGRGLSTAPPPGETLTGGPDESTLAERQARDTMCVLDHLGIQAVHWFGQGGGGVTGLVSAVLWPGRVKTLVMSGAPIRLPESFLKTCSLGEPTMAAALEKYGVQAFNRRGLWRQVIDREQLSPRMEAWILAQRDKVPLDVMVRTARWMQTFDYSAWLPKVQCPVLIIAPEKESAVPVEECRGAAARIPNARLVIFEGVGRGVHLFMPERTAGEILKFIGGQMGPRP